MRSTVTSDNARLSHQGRVDHCHIWSSSIHFYRVSIGANAAFLALFSISLLAYILTYTLTRRATAFTVSMLSGVILEVQGYAGRIMIWKNQWDNNGFLMQVVCLTFMAGGIYLIAPESYTRIFIPCDLGSLLLQAAGGGIASAASHSGKNPNTGDNIMIAGLSIQVVTLLIFMILCVDFALRSYKRYRSMGEDAFDQNPIFVQTRGSLRFKGFVGTLTLATICIFWRSVYRVAELSEGWTGNLIRHQWLFVGFEGIMVIVTCLALNVFNPVFAVKEAMTGFGGLRSKRKLRKQEHREEQEKSTGITGENSRIKSASAMEHAAAA
ncbi:hypothetical protein OIDMADRAFT_46178 [Oidiodendron maius Zn]|uniref:RTA1 like protein n=1 Tax=Oidiodendron maius (strain Zn) TaxID=913774 RepID=A0A0C3C3T9_OIDMZ|nr:hypothetical protein OIDMADRAFT_46178 [Oidiodendron maius Zn]